MICFKNVVFWLVACVLTGYSLSAVSQIPTQPLEQHVLSAVTQQTATLLSPLSSDTELNLSIILPLRNQAILDQLLLQLNDPSSPKFRQYLSVQQFTSQFGPTEDDYAAVQKFARLNGFTVQPSATNRQVVSIRGSVATIEAAFHLQINLYKHPTENRNFFAADRVPTLALNVPIRYITGLDNFSLPHPALRQSSISPSNTTGSGPSGYFVPSDMRAAYYPSGALTGSGQCVDMVEFGGYGISTVVGNFNGAASSSPNGSNYVIHYTTGGTTYNVPVNNVLIDGASAGISGNDGEQALDIAQSIGMAPGLSQVRVYIAPYNFVSSGSYDQPGSGQDTDLFNSIATENACKQISMSWNWAPQNLTYNDGIFKEFASQGQSFFVASGDYGAWPNGYHYPEEDAYAIAVGGTDLATSGPGGAWSSETAWGSSGGGHSPDGVAIPTWQGNLNGVNGSSTTVRNAPDVAMEANVDNVYWQNGASDGAEGGTSYAAPRWAGFLALVNQQAVASGAVSAGSGVGFINPAVYNIGASSQYASAFHDIVSGSNGSYSAGAGYDLVTGWGSPQGQATVNAIISPPPPPTKPWYASLSTSTCGGGSVSFSISQSGNGNSLTWNYSASSSQGWFENGQSFSLKDSSGTLLSGSNGNGQTTGFSGTITASRIPTSTPTVTFSGAFVGQYSGCYNYFNSSAQAYQ